MIPWWAGPVTIVTAVAAVLVVQRISVALLEAPPPFLDGYVEPAIITAVLVAVAVGVFGVVLRQATHPRRTFTKIATAALLVSLLPDIAVGMGRLFVREGWTLATVFMLQHVVAWAVVVGVLPRTVRQQPLSATAE